MKNNIDNANNDELKFVNFNEFKTIIKSLKILCTNNNVSGNIFNKLFNIDTNINQGKKSVPSDTILRDILNETCPQQISVVNKLFNINSFNATPDDDVDMKQTIIECKKETLTIAKRGRKKKEDILESTSETKKRRKKDKELIEGPLSTSDLYDYMDLIFRCVSATVIKKSDVENNDKYYRVNDWLEDGESCQPYTYFNTKHTSSRVSVNETKKKLEDYEKLMEHFDRLLPHRSSMNDVYG